MITAVLVIGGILGFAFAVFMLATMWKLFDKAGEPGWAIFVPVYNFMVMLRIAGLPVWLVFLYFVPVADLVIWAIVCVGIARKFGKGVGFALGTVLLPFVFFPLLAFGSAEHVAYRQMLERAKKEGLFTSRRLKTTTSSGPLLEVRNLRTQFRTDDGIVKAVDDVSLTIHEKEIVGVVGESGCGKSVTQLSVMRLIRPPGKIEGGQILFEGRDLAQLEANGDEMRAIRGSQIAMIFQEPMTSLNPVLTIGRQLTEMPELHLGISRLEARFRATQLLEMVGIPNAATRLGDYPHQFSGGMRQRAMIAMALSCNPRLIIADEPTTALDVTTQAQLLELMKDLVAKFDSSLVIVTHNLGVVARYAQTLYIMYAGRIVESGPCKEVFSRPRHPYTIGLLRCVPRIDEGQGRTLEAIPGLPPNLTCLPGQCAFLPRCEFATERCKKDPWPELEEVGPDHKTRCFVNPEGVKT